MKTGTGNCLLLDNTASLNIRPEAVNVARRMEVQSGEVDVPKEDMLPELSDEYKDIVITKFVVKKMKEKITCLPWSQALTIDGPAHSFRLSPKTITRPHHREIHSEEDQ